MKVDTYLKVMCLKWIFSPSAFLKSREVHDTENSKGSLTGRKNEDRLSLPLSSEKLFWMLALNFPHMKGYGISTGHIPQTSSTPTE